MPSANDFDAVMAMIHESLHYHDIWDDLQHRTEKRTGGALRLPAFDEQRAISELVPQLQRIIGAEPPPAALSFFYFGLFDAWDADTQQEDVGFYLAGGTTPDPEEALLNGDMDYFPDDRFLESSLLSSIYALQSEYPEQRDYIGYTLVLATAALLAKATSEHLNITVPAYVGFDSGDYMLVTSR